MKNYWQKHQRMVKILAKKKNRGSDENLVKSLDSTFRYYLDTLIMMIPLLIAGTYINGIDAVRLAFFGVLGAILSEVIACKILGKDNALRDLSAISAGLAISLMLPASAPGYLALFGSVFAVVVAKVPFGSARRAPFVPAAAGFAFLSLCFPKMVFAYGEPGGLSAASILSTSENFVKATSFGEMLTYGKSISLNPLEIIAILTGKNPGPMGTTCMLAMIGIAIYLLCKSRKRFLVSFSCLFACALMAMIFPRINSGAFTSLTMELSAGSLVFSALVLLPDPATAPRKTVHSIIYGFSAGIICMLLRYFGRYENDACFGILIVNAFAPAVTDAYNLLTEYLREKKIILRAVKKDNALAADSDTDTGIFEGGVTDE